MTEGPGYLVLTFGHDDVDTPSGEVTNAREDYIAKGNIILPILTFGEGDLFARVPPPMIERLRHEE